MLATQKKFSRQSFSQFSYKVVPIGPVLVGVDAPFLGVAAVVHKHKINTLDVLMEITNICIPDLLLDLQGDEETL